MDREFLVPLAFVLLLAISIGTAIQATMLPAAPSQIVVEQNCEWDLAIVVDNDSIYVTSPQVKNNHVYPANVPLHLHLTSK